MKKYYIFLISTIISLASCTPTSSESSSQNLQETQKEEALTDIQKVAKETCACMKEHLADSDKSKVFICMMEIRRRYTNIDEMDQEESRAEINRQCLELANQFKKAYGNQ